MWGGQFLWCGPGKWDFRPELHGLEGAAIMAIRDPGQVYSYLDIEYGMEGDALRCKLPSGRFLTYHNARLVPGEDKLRRGPSVQILFEGYNSNAQKGPVGWMVMETYGAWLFQNVVQATAADLQFEALMRLEAAGYPVVMHTHDEATVEVPKDFGSVKKMTRIMIKRPSWAKWWPIRAAGWQGKRSRKD
jgi:DNA polymerase